jgi:predicted membrane protein
MNDIEKRNEIPSQSSLTKRGLSAIFCAAGGVFLFVLQIISRFRVLGLIIGVVVSVFGIAALMSKDPNDRKPGLVITAAGVLTVLSKTGIPFVRTISGTLLAIGAVGLLAAGLWNGIKFFMGLRKRS